MYSSKFNLPSPFFLNKTKYQELIHIQISACTGLGSSSPDSIPAQFTLFLDQTPAVIDYFKGVLFHLGVKLRGELLNDQGMVVFRKV